MSRYLGAIWDPISLKGGGTNGPMHSYTGIVLHVNDANSYNLHDYFNDGAHNVTAHFQCAKDGTLWQYIDTMNSSWCQSAGNDDYLSVETQGFPNEPLTNEQLNALAGLYNWLYHTHYIPYKLSNVVGEFGFAWHGMGGDAWGGHPSCPGELRKAQRATILSLAKAIDNPVTIGGEMFELVRAIKPDTGLFAWNAGGLWYHVPNANVQNALETSKLCVADARMISHTEFNAYKALALAARA